MNNTAKQTNGQDIAATILNQLGGHKFLAMTGVKQPMFDADGTLTFKPGKNAGKVNYVSISYDVAKDLYNMKFENIRMNKKTYDLTRKLIAEFEGVYADQLQELFTKVTGMYTSL